MKKLVVLALALGVSGQVWAYKFATTITNTILGESIRVSLVGYDCNINIRNVEILGGQTKSYVYECDVPTAKNVGVHIIYPDGTTGASFFGCTGFEGNKQNIVVRKINGKYGSSSSCK